MTRSTRHPRRLWRTPLALLVALLVGLVSMAPASAVATAPPNAPTDLTVTLDPAIPWHLRLTWTDNTPQPDPNAETFIEVERCQGVGCTDWANIMNAATPGFDMTTFLDQDANKPDNTTYSYRVRGRNDAGYSDWSNVAAGTTGWRAPAAPTNLTATYVGAGSNGLNGNTQLTWTDNASTEFGYAVIRCEPIDCAGTRVTVSLPVNATGYLDTTVVDGAEYWYSVQAIGGSGLNGFSPVITHVAGAGLPAPTRVAATLTSSGIKLTWRNRISRPVRIWRCDTNVCIDGITGQYQQMLFTVKTTVAAGTNSWTDRFTRQAGTPYFYRLQVVTANAVSHPVYVRIVG